MAEYEIVIHLRTSLEPTRVPLPGVSEADAEADREALIWDIDQARLAEAPVIAFQTRSGFPADPLPLAPQDVTEIDLTEVDGSA